MKINIVTVGVSENHVSNVIKQVKDIEEKHNVDCTITVNIPYRRPYSTEMVLPELLYAFLNASTASWGTRRCSRY